MLSNLSRQHHSAGTQFSFFEIQTIMAFFEKISFSTTNVLLKYCFEENNSPSRHNTACESPIRVTVCTLTRILKSLTFDTGHLKATSLT